MRKAPNKQLNLTAAYDSGLLLFSALRFSFNIIVQVYLVVKYFFNYWRCPSKLAVCSGRQVSCHAVIKLNPIV